MVIDVKSFELRSLMDDGSGKDFYITENQNRAYILVRLSHNVKQMAQEEIAGLLSLSPSAITIEKEYILIEPLTQKIDVDDNKIDQIRKLVATLESPCDP